MVAAQARRRSQYKSLTPNTPGLPRIFSSNSRRRSSSGRLFTDGDAIASLPAERPDSQKVYLRDRFKARCLERAVKARAKAIKGKRYLDQRSSDDFMMDYGDDDDDDDEAENEEDIMQDEVLVFFKFRVSQVSFCD